METLRHFFAYYRTERNQVLRLILKHFKWLGNRGGFAPSRCRWTSQCWLSGRFCCPLSPWSGFVRLNLQRQTRTSKRWLKRKKSSGRVRLSFRHWAKCVSSAVCRWMISRGWSAPRDAVRKGKREKRQALLWCQKKTKKREKKSPKVSPYRKHLAFGCVPKGHLITTC